MGRRCVAVRRHAPGGKHPPLDPEFLAAADGRKRQNPSVPVFRSARRLARRHPRQRSGVRRCGLPAVRRPVLPRSSHSGDARRRFDVARTGCRVGVARPQGRLRNHRHRHEGQALPVFRDALLQDLRRLRGDRDVDRDQPHGEETRDALPVRIGLHARPPGRHVADAFPRHMGSGMLPPRRTADRRHEGAQEQGRRTQHAARQPLADDLARRTPPGVDRPRHRRHAGLGRQLPHRPGQRQHPHHAPLRGHQRGAVAIHAATPRGLHDPGIRLHVQRRGQERREPQHPPMGAPPPAQPRNRASRRAAQLVGGRLFQGQPGGHGPDDGRPGGPGRRTVRDGRRLVRRQIPAQQRRDEPRRLDGLPRETAAGHRGSDRVGPQTRREVRHLDRTRDDQHPERTL